MLESIHMAACYGMAVLIYAAPVILVICAAFAIWEASR